MVALLIKKQNKNQNKTVQNQSDLPTEGSEPISGMYTESRTYMTNLRLRAYALILYECMKRITNIIL